MNFDFFPARDGSLPPKGIKTKSMRRLYLFKKGRQPFWACISSHFGRHLKSFPSPYTGDASKTPRRPEKNCNRLSLSEQSGGTTANPRFLFNFLGRYLQSLLLPQFLRERGNGKTHYARLTTTILGIRFFFRTATRAMNLFPRVSQDLKVKAGVTQVQGFPEFF